MDAAKMFVIVLTILAVGILAFLELKSRRSRQQSQSSPAGTDQDTKRTP